MKSKILLINPDHENKKNNFPWGVLSVGSFLTNACDRDVTLLDTSTIGINRLKEEIEKNIANTLLVGIGTFTTDLLFTREICTYIKSLNRNTPIIVGGPHPTLEPEQTCQHENIDFVSYSYGESTTEELVRELHNDKPDFSKVPGLIYKTRSGSVVRTPKSNFPGFYGTNYDLLEKSVRDTFSNYVQVLSGRGCSFRCTFCYNSVIRQTFTGRQSVDLVTELRRLVEKYNPKTVYFRDENFFQDKKRLFDFIEDYKKEKFTFKWRVTCRAGYIYDGYVNDKVLKDLEEVNCDTLKIGIESGSERMTGLLKKSVTLRQVYAAIGHLTKHNAVKGSYSFISGLPGESFDDIKQTLLMIKEIDRQQPEAEIIGPQYFRIYPGGTLYDDILVKYKFKTPDSLDDYVEKFLDPKGMYKNIDYPWINDTNRDIARYSDLMVFLYRVKFRNYLTPKRLCIWPFIIAAKLRFKYERFEYLYDMRLAAAAFEAVAFVRSLKKINAIYRISEFWKFVKLNAAYRTQAFLKSFSLAPARRLAASRGTLPME